jgi:hypothetical protein
VSQNNLVTTASNSAQLPIQWVPAILGLWGRLILILILNVCISGGKWPVSLLASLNTTPFLFGVQVSVNYIYVHMYI